VRPIDIRTQFLTGHFPAALTIDIDRQGLATGAITVRDIFQMLHGGLALSRESLPGVRAEVGKVGLEVHDGADYHHTVMKRSTPFREYTGACDGPHTYRVENHEDRQGERRRVLHDYIVEHHDGKRNRLAVLIGASQSYISDVLRGKKPFGEKAAKRLETQINDAGLPPISLVDPRSAPSSVASLELELIEAFRRLPPPRQVQLVKDVAVEAMRTTHRPPD
jgi:hypothetical protein